MDKIAKFLLKLNSKQRAVVLAVIDRLLENDESNLDIRKLRGHDDMYRARVGKIRVIFRKGGNQHRILDVDFRDDNTYRDF